MPATSPDRISLQQELHSIRQALDRLILALDPEQQNRATADPATALIGDMRAKLAVLEAILRDRQKHLH
jgi:hypothetical protein